MGFSLCVLSAAFRSSSELTINFYKLICMPACSFASGDRRFLRSPLSHQPLDIPLWTDVASSNLHLLLGAWRLRPALPGSAGGEATTKFSHTVKRFLCANLFLRSHQVAKHPNNNLVCLPVVLKSKHMKEKPCPGYVHLFTDFIHSAQRASASPEVTASLFASPCLWFLKFSSYPYL